MAPPPLLSPPPSLSLSLDQGARAIGGKEGQRPVAAYFPMVT